MKRILNRWKYRMSQKTQPYCKNNHIRYEIETDYLADIESIYYVYLLIYEKHLADIQFDALHVPYMQL